MVNVAFQQLNGLLAHRPQWLPDRCQPGPDRVRNRCIIETRDTELMRDTYFQFLGSRQGASRHFVVAREQGCWTILLEQ